jgi:hypothetical protein
MVAKDIRVTKYEGLDGLIHYVIRPMKGAVTSKGVIIDTLSKSEIVKILIDELES